MSASEHARRYAGTVRLFLELAVVGAFVWFWWWHPVTGVASGGEFYWRTTSIEGSITGTARYLVVATVVGLVGGLLAARRHGRQPWGALGVSVAAGVAAGLLMALTGHLLGPEDADAVAARSEDGSRVLVDLRVEGTGAYLAAPAAALTATAGVFLVRRRDDEAPAGSAGGGPGTGGSGEAGEAGRSDGAAVAAGRVPG
ncbi:hypothetical protein RDV89_06575 [Nocardioides zeae]|uniref:Uncharacterized protein n=1 Tax=Nocardioides imazamoxiresistens TaxID=3231893 RepID=A0ABU3PU29_9ACTN|nr:hypothetical protein [Nocardioides zeae]MDT9592723.1 hypothetical protein [Nocardioides zeae]